MTKIFVILALALPFAANAVPVVCNSSKFAVSIMDKVAQVYGGGLNGAIIKRIPRDGDPDDRNSWPEYANDDGSIDLLYFNAVEPNSPVSKTKFTARLDINDTHLDLVCDKP